MTLAERIQRELAEYCLKCEIAGSIRRARPEVNDIDLVILPKPGATQLIKARCKLRCRVITDGDQNFIVALNLFDDSAQMRKIDFQLDIFFAHNGVDDLLAPQPTNYGSILLSRTGSKDHNKKLCTIAKQRDMAWKPYIGLFAGGEWVFRGQESEYEGGTLIASETEEKIFEALGLKWIPPVLREVDFNPGPSIEQILNQTNASQPITS